MNFKIDIEEKWLPLLCLMAADTFVSSFKVLLYYFFVCSVVLLYRDEERRRIIIKIKKNSSQSRKNKRADSIEKERYLFLFFLFS